MSGSAAAPAARAGARVTLRDAARRFEEAWPRGAGGRRRRGAGRGALTSTGRAAVLLGLFEESAGGALSVWLTQRGGRLSSHAGEVALPGGKQEGAETAEETALREADEEIGLGSGDCRVVGRLEACLSKHRLLVSPVVAAVRDGFMPRIVSQEEVATIFSCPLAEFLSDERHRAMDIPNRGRVHFFDYIDPASGKDFIIWGLTAHLLIEAARHVYQREPNFEFLDEGGEEARGKRPPDTLERPSAQRAGKL